MPKVVRRKSHLRNGRVVRAHPLRISQANIATGAMGMGTEYSPPVLMDDIRRSERRVERDEQDRILTERIDREQFKRKMVAADAAARKADFERKVHKKLAPAWSEE